MTGYSSTRRSPLRGNHSIATSSSRNSHRWIVERRGGHMDFWLFSVPCLCPPCLIALKIFKIVISRALFKYKPHEKYELDNPIYIRWHRWSMICHTGDDFGEEQLTNGVMDWLPFRKFNQSVWQLWCEDVCDWNLRCVRSFCPTHGKRKRWGYNLYNNLYNMTSLSSLPWHMLFCPSTALFLVHLWIFWMSPYRRRLLCRAIFLRSYVHIPTRITEDEQRGF